VYFFCCSVRYTHLWCVKNASTIIGTTDNGFIPSKPLFPGSAIIFLIVSNIGFLSRALEIEHKDSFSSKDTELRRWNSAANFGDPPAGQIIKNDFKNKWKEIPYPHYT